MDLKEYLYDDVVLDLYDQKGEIISHTQKGNNGRGLNITITVKGVCVLLSNDARCNLFLKKPDGHIVYVPCNITDGKINVQFTRQMLAMSGYAEMEVQIFDVANNINVTTPIGILEIRDSNFSDLAEPSEDDFPFIFKLREDVDKAIAVIETTKTVAERADEVATELKNISRVVYWLHNADYTSEHGKINADTLSNMVKTKSTDS